VSGSSATFVHAKQHCFASCCTLQRLIAPPAAAATHTLYMQVHLQHTNSKRLLENSPAVMVHTTLETALHRTLPRVGLAPNKLHAAAYLLTCSSTAAGSTPANDKACTTVLLYTLKQTPPPATSAHGPHTPPAAVCSQLGRQKHTSILQPQVKPPAFTQASRWCSHTHSLAQNTHMCTTEATQPTRQHRLGPRESA
jgi:hypothetical protein